MQRETDEVAQEDQFGAERWGVYLEVARKQHEQEEERWRAAQDKAKTIFAVAAFVATLLFGRLDWATGRAAIGWERWAWLVLVGAGALALLAALFLAAGVFTPKRAFAIEPPETALEKLARVAPSQAKQYLGETYARTVRANAGLIDRELFRVRLATRLVIASLVIAVVQLAVILAAPAHTEWPAQRGPVTPAVRTGRSPGTRMPGGEARRRAIVPPGATGSASLAERPGRYPRRSPGESSGDGKAARTRRQ